MRNSPIQEIHIPAAEPKFPLLLVPLPVAPPTHCYTAGRSHAHDGPQRRNTQPTATEARSTASLTTVVGTLEMPVQGQIKSQL